MNDDDLRRLVSDSVSDVEPGHRLDEIRARTARPDRRPRWYAAGGVVLATAAAVTAIAVVTDLGDADGPQPAPSPTHAVDTHAVPAYYVGSTPAGARLFREFAAVDAAVPVLEASLALLETGPADPDYATLWEPGSFVGAGVEGEVINVDLADEALRDRPAGMTQAEAELAVWQVIYTVQGALRDGRSPVQFRLDGSPVDEVYGEPTRDPLGNRPEFALRAMVNISDPAEGTEVSGSFLAKGVADSFEATVPWEIRQGDRTVKEGFATAKGWTPGVLYPWRTEVDVSDLAPGQYTFVASTDDPSGGAEGAGATSDTRTIVVQ